MTYPGSSPNPNDFYSRLTSLEVHNYHIWQRFEDGGKAQDKDREQIRAELKDLWAALDQQNQKFSEGIERQDRIREALLRRGGGWLIYFLVAAVAVLASGYFSESSPVHALLRIIGLS